MVGRPPRCRCSRRALLPRCTRPTAAGGNEKAATTTTARRRRRRTRMSNGGSSSRRRRFRRHLRAASSSRCYHHHHHHHHPRSSSSSSSSSLPSSSLSSGDGGGAFPWSAYARGGLLGRPRPSSVLVGWRRRRPLPSRDDNTSRSCAGGWKGALLSHRDSLCSFNRPSTP